MDSGCGHAAPSNRRRNARSGRSRRGIGVEVEREEGTVVGADEDVAGGVVLARVGEPTDGGDDDGGVADAEDGTRAAERGVEVDRVDDSAVVVAEDGDERGALWDR